MAGHVMGRKWWIAVSDQEDDSASDEATNKIDHFISPAREPLSKLPKLSIIDEGVSHFSSKGLTLINGRRQRRQQV